MTESRDNNVRMPAPVRLARLLRHSAMLRGADPLWNLLRPAYRRLLSLFSGRRGLAVEIAGLGTIRLPSSYLQEDVPPGEIPALSEFLSALGPDDAFYDVGASVGMYSFFALNRLGPGGVIYAFEPDANSCTAFAAHLASISPACPVRLNRCFLSNQSTADPASADTESKAPPAAGGSATRHLYLFNLADAAQAPQLRLDDFVSAGRRPPDVIKCDIEGAELLFLRGAERTLRRSRPVLLLSLHPSLLPHFGHSTADVESFLKECGYSIRILNDDGEWHCLCRPVAI